MSNEIKHVCVLVKCDECGHEQTVSGVEVNESYYFGSGFDFCDVCDGVPTPLKLVDTE